VGLFFLSGEGTLRFSGARKTREPTMGDRIDVSLACTECESRNYKTTRKPEQVGQIEKKKFCPHCKRHTIHKETK